MHRPELFVFNHLGEPCIFHSSKANSAKFRNLKKKCELTLQSNGELYK